MPEKDYDDEMATQYRLARQRFPEADRHEIAAEIVRNAPDDALLAWAADRLVYWEGAPPGDRKALAEDHALTFVFSMEDDDMEWS